MTMTRDDAGAVTARIVEALAEAEGVDPLELDFRLEEVIDTEAVESLIEHDGDEWHLQITAGGHEIIVDPDGTLSIDGEPFE